MAKKREARFIISAENKTASAFGKITGDLKGLGGQFTSFQKLAGAAVAAVVGNAAIRGFTNMIQRALDLTDALRDSSIKLGIGVSDLQAYQLAAGNAGIESGKLVSLIEKLNKAAGEIKLGGGNDKTVAALGALGITVEEVRESNPAQLFEEVIEGLGGIEDPASRAALAMQIFGKSGGAALGLVADGAESLRESRELLDELGLSLSQLDANNVDRANDAIGTLSVVADAAKQKFAAELSPAIAEVAERMLQAGRDGQAMGEGIASAAQTTITTFERIAAAGQVIGNTFQVAWAGIGYVVSAVLVDITRAIGDLIEFVGSDVPQAFAAMLKWGEDSLRTLEQGFVDFGTAIANAVIGAMNSIIKAIEGMVNKALPALNQVIDAANSINPFGAIPRASGVALDTIAPEGKKKVTPFNFGSSDIETFGQDQAEFFQGLADGYAQQQFDFGTQFFDQTQDLNDAWGDLFSEDGMVLPEKQLEDLGGTIDATSESAQNLANTFSGSGGGSGSGGAGSVKDAIKSAEAQAKKFALAAVEASDTAAGAFERTFTALNQYGQSVTNSLEGAIDEFTRSGKLDFKEFARSAIADLAAIALKAALLGGIMGNSQYGGNGSGFIGSLLSSIFSGSISTAGAVKGIPVTNASGGYTYEGGGFTGMGARSGGIDGKGGFPAILHPNETVLDHAKGQGMGGSVNYSPTIIIKETMPAAIGARIVREAIEGSKAALKQINERGGNRRRAYGLG